MKKKWKDPGFANGYFQVAPIMKPKVLNEWVASRVQAPDRTFAKLGLSGVKDFKYTHAALHEHGDPPRETLNHRYLQILDKQQ